MDLLGSILNSMEKPPENKEEKKARMSKHFTTYRHMIFNIMLLTFKPFANQSVIASLVDPGGI